MNFPGIFICLQLFTIFTYANVIPVPNFINKYVAPFPVSIIHHNDFHARFEESNPSGGACDPGQKCIGGYARVVHIVKSLLEARNSSNPIYLNAGDNFQGTLWYNIGRWNVTSYFLNLLPADAITLGNHEFDHGIEGVVPFLQHISSPMVVSNIDDSLEPSMQGLYKKSTVLVRNGRKIGIIGVILQTTDEIANTEKLKFFNETESVRAEAERLRDEEGVNIIIVLSHCGLDVDRIIAKNGGPLIDVIVGGHSHTFLFSGDKPPGVDKPADKYPVEVIQDSGRKVLIVQAAAFAKYVGDLTVYFDEAGEVLHYEGAPIYLDNDVPQDLTILEELKPWKEIIDAEGITYIGETRVTLSRSRCKNYECNIGSFVSDAFVHRYLKDSTPSEESWTSAAIAINNAGGIRATLNKGNLTFAHLVTAVPFENTVDSYDLEGKYLREALEYSVSKTYSGGQFQNMLQVSGLKVVFNVTRPVGQRLIDVKVRCQKCNIPEFFPLNDMETYRIISPSFLSNGGDGFKMIRDHKTNYKVGPLDIDCIVDYVKYLTPITYGTDGRIILYTS